MINNNPTNDNPIDDEPINEDFIEENSIDENLTKVSPWFTFREILKKFIKLCLNGNRQTKHIIECIQLSFIYFFAFVVLSYAIQGYLGGFPEFIFSLFPNLQEILNVPFLKLLAMPEKTFLVYLVLLEFIMSRSRYSFSLLVKFNILLIFLLEMVQNLLISYWDLFCNREIEYSYIGLNTGIFVQDLAILFFITLYLTFVLVYGYCFLRSCAGRFPVFPGSARFITDSVAFWLRIKIPKRKGNKK
jgi:hypothetical protein